MEIISVQTSEDGLGQPILSSESPTEPNISKIPTLESLDPEDEEDEEEVEVAGSFARLIVIEGL